MFLYYSNLTRTVQINSSNISNVSDAFSGTNKSITINVPSSSITYATFNKLTAATGKPSNVTLVNAS